MFDEILDSLGKITQSGVNVYRTATGQDATVKPTKPAPAKPFNWQSPVVIGGGVIALAVIGWLVLRKKK